MIVTLVSLLSCNDNVKENNTLETNVIETKEIKNDEIVDRNFEHSGVVTEISNKGDVITTVKLANEKTKTIEFDSYDLEEDYNIYKAINIDLSDKNSVALNFKNQVNFEDDDLVIKSGGVYVLTGELNRGHVKVIGDFKERVEIVLDNVSIKTNKTIAINSLTLAPICIRLANGSENYIGVDFDNKELKQYAVYANGPLSVVGNGNLSVDEGFLNAIGSVDVLTFISGNYTLFGSVSAISAGTCIIIKNGIYNILSGSVALITSSDVSGHIYIEDGEFNIISKGYGVVAKNEIIFTGGSMRIDSEKTSLKGKSIDIIGGTYNIKSMEDAIIATDDLISDVVNNEVYIRFIGGDTNIDSWYDGLQSFGDIYLEGGKIFISGPIRHKNNIISYKGNITLNGSDMIALGASDKVQDLGENPNQTYIIVYYKERYARQKGSAYQVMDMADNIIMSFTPEKDYRVAIITSDKLQIGNKYVLVSRDRETEIVINDKKILLTE